MKIVYLFFLLDLRSTSFPTMALRVSDWIIFCRGVRPITTCRSAPFPYDFDLRPNLRATWCITSRSPEPSSFENAMSKNSHLYQFLGNTRNLKKLFVDSISLGTLTLGFKKNLQNLVVSRSETLSTKTDEKC